jgi:hypothetical protein
MVVVPGLSESLRAVDKRIVRFDAMNTLLSVGVASSARRARCPSCSHGSSNENPRAWPTGSNAILRSRCSPATVQVRTLMPRKA